MAFIIFNRPEQAARVFEAIAKARPKVLLVVGDGPRQNVPGEAEKVDKCRELLERIDWPCEVMTNFSAINLGCRNRVSTGLDWVFSKVDEAIILEDDCLPSQDFFDFTSELLDRYRQDERVGSISGSNPGHFSSDQFESYHFSSFPAIWGWATWSRVWTKYNASIPNWPDKRSSGFLREVLNTKNAVRFWKESLDQVHAGKIDTWDYQLSFLHWTENYLSVVPNQNLVTNIGFGPDATHTLNASSAFANSKTGVLEFPIVHPLDINRNLGLDYELELLKFSKPIFTTVATRLFNFFPRSIKKLLISVYFQFFR